MVDVKQVDVVGVRVELPSNKPILVLREVDGGRHVPIWVGAPEAAAIAHAMEGIEPPRPLTHDLLVDLLDEFDIELERVEITRMVDGIYFADLVFASDRRVSARSSDAVAIALRAQVPVLVAEQVLEDVGVAVQDDDEEEVEKFREFLDHVSAEDFENPDDSGGEQST